MWMWTDRNDSAVIEVYDGPSSSEHLLASVNIRNYTRPQSIVTTSNTIFIRFKAEARTEMTVFMKLTSGYSEFDADTVKISIQHLPRIRRDDIPWS